VTRPRAKAWAELPARVRNRLLAAMRETVTVSEFDLKHGAGTESFAVELQEEIDGYRALIRLAKEAARRPTKKGRR
jgi:hypothetical protein